MRFRTAERIADAVLYEGYVLYPYRASSMKNRVRWQFGIVAPQAPEEVEGEPAFAQTECLIEPGERSRLTLRVRCLTVAPRPAGEAAPPGAPASWLDATPQSIDVESIPLDDAVSLEVPVTPNGIAAVLRVSSEAVDGFVRLRLRLENLEPWRDEYRADRDAMLCRSLVSAHILMGLDGGRFISLLDPPEAATALANACVNRHAWPVLVGETDARDVMLSAPIVLYDYPKIAPESPGDLFDGTEIDEILSLRIMTLTEEEKREARATDPRAAAIIDRTDALTADAMAKLHGTFRPEDFFNPAGEQPPEKATVTIAGVTVTKGSRVRLRPTRRADAMDMFLKDQVASVAGVYRDVDERTMVAVTIDADPGADLHESFGRFFYFDVDEVEPIGEQEAV